MDMLSFSLKLSELGLAPSGCQQQVDWDLGDLLGYLTAKKMPSVWGHKVGKLKGAPSMPAEIPLQSQVSVQWPQRRPHSDRWCE